MRIAIIGDLHFISPTDPFPSRRERRQHFAQAWPSLARTVRQVKREAPDLVVFLGDLVDYFSDENRDFALEQISTLNRPWFVTPGNHDFSCPEEPREGPGDGPRDEQEIRQRWKSKGVAMGNRCLDADGVRLLLIDSANSSVPAGTAEWIRKQTAGSERNILLTHVPLNTRHMADFILSVDPARDLRKYVQSGAPSLFEDAVRGRVEAVFSGHLHFAGHPFPAHGTSMHLLPLGLHAFGKSYRDQGQIGIFETTAKADPFRMVPS
jgi:predicted phosphodiesterase